MKRHRKSPLKRIVFLSLFLIFVSIVLGSRFNYDIELTELSNGEKVDSRIYPDLQDMFDTARADGLELFVREGYRTQEEQQEIMDEKIMAYMEEGYSRKEARNRCRKRNGRKGNVFGRVSGVIKR